MARTSFADLWKRKGSFMLQTFALFMAQLLITYVVMTLVAKSDKFVKYMMDHTIVYFLFALILPLIFILVMIFVPMNTPLKLLLFTGFSVCLGVSLVLLKKYASPEVIKAALLGTLGVFVAMFLVGMFLMMAGVNLWWLGAILMFALFGIIITSIVFLFIDPSKRALRIKAAITIAVFGLLVMYDTNQILQRDYVGDFVTAALDYYLDIFNIFVNLVSYFTNSE